MNTRRRFAIVSSLLFSSNATAATTPLVNHGDNWRWHKGNAGQPAASWKTISDASLDATWFDTVGGFGYSTDNTNETNQCKTVLADMQGNYSTVYMRKQFTVGAGLDTNLHLILSMDFDDGSIAWLDGVFLSSANVTGAPTEPSNTALANASHESSRGNSGSSPQPASTNDYGAVGARLAPGTHTLAIIGLNNSLGGSSDCIQVADLFLAEPPVPVTNTWRLVNSPIVVPTT